MSKPKAFTLIELLVVVSIIALLVAILLPVLSNVKFATRTTQCASRLKQMGIAVTAYSVDNKNNMPHAMDPGTDRYLNALDGEYYRWEHKPWVIKSNGKFDYIPLIEPYVSDMSEIFVCPHIDYVWGDKNYRPNGATMIPYAMYWGISNTGSPVASRIPMTKLGESFGPGNNLDGGGITQDSRYRILASDYVRLGTSHGVNQYPNGTPFSTPKGMANHPPTGGEYFFAPSNNGNGAGVRLRHLHQRQRQLPLRRWQCRTRRPDPAGHHRQQRRTPLPQRRPLARPDPPRGIMTT